MSDIEWNGTNPFKAKCCICGRSFFRRIGSKAESCSRLCGQKTMGNKAKKRWKNLTDDVVIGRLTLLGYNEIPKQLIIVKRKQMKLKREIYDTKKKASYVAR